MHITDDNEVQKFGSKLQGTVTHFVSSMGKTNWNNYGGFPINLKEAIH